MLTNCLVWLILFAGVRYYLKLLPEKSKQDKK